MVTTMSGDDDDGGGGDDQTPVIVGSVIGCLAFVAIVILLVIIWYKCFRNKRHGKVSEDKQQVNVTVEPTPGVVYENPRYSQNTKNNENNDGIAAKDVEYTPRSMIENPKYQQQASLTQHYENVGENNPAFEHDEEEKHDNVKHSTNTSTTDSSHIYIDLLPEPEKQSVYLSANYPDDSKGEEGQGHGRSHKTEVLDKPHQPSPHMDHRHHLAGTPGTVQTVNSRPDTDNDEVLNDGNKKSSEQIDHNYYDFERQKSSEAEEGPYVEMSPSEKPQSEVLENMETEGSSTTEDKRSSEHESNLYENIQNNREVSEDLKLTSGKDMPVW